MKSLEQLILEAGFEQEHVPFFSTVAKIINLCADDIAPNLDFLLNEDKLEPSSIKESVNVSNLAREILVNGVFTYIEPDMQDKLTNIGAFLGDALTTNKRFTTTGSPSFTEVEELIKRGLGATYCFVLALATAYKESFEKIGEESILDSINEVFDYKYLIEEEDFVKYANMDFTTDYKHIDLVEDDDDSSEFELDFPELEFGKLVEDDM